MYRSKNRNFKATFDIEETRRRREEVSFSLSKVKREQMMEKRRQRVDAPGLSSEANNSFTSPIKPTLDKLSQYVQGMQSDDAKIRLENCRSIRKLLSVTKSPPITEVIESCVVPIFVQYLGRFQEPELQYESAWALTNIVSGTEEQTREVLKYDAVPGLVLLLSSSNPRLAEQAVWALSNIAGDSTECRDHVLESGAMHRLIQLIQDTHEVKSVLRNSTWCLSNLCRGKPQPDSKYSALALPVLSKLINTDDEEVVTDACWALSYISDDNSDTQEKIAAVCQTGVIPKLVELVMSCNDKVTTPSVRTLGNIVTGNDSQTDAVLAAGGMRAFVYLLSHKSKNLRKESCWAVSNVTAGTREQIYDAMKNHALLPLIHILKHDSFKVQKEAAWAVSNIATGGNNEQIEMVIRHNGVQALCGLLNCGDTDIQIVLLDALNECLRVGSAVANGGENQICDIMEECEGLDSVEALQQHEHKDVWEKASQIIQEYFLEEDEEEVTDLVPSSEGNQFTFGAIAPASNGSSGGNPQQPFTFDSGKGFVF